VPDYNQLEVVPPLARSEIEVPYDPMRGTEPNLLFSNGNDTLHIRGYIIDAIKSIGNVQAEVLIPNPLPELSERIKEAQVSQALIQTSF
jgi:hypothetical protein